MTDLSAMEIPANLDRRTVLAAAAGVAALTAAGMAFPSLAADETVRLPAPDYVPKDTYFGKAYIDVDELRDKPVRFRYVHGGFEGTQTSFAFYFPEPKNFKGRFYHTIQGRDGGSENATLEAVENYDRFGVVPPLTLLAAFDVGAYLVDTNQGHIGATSQSGITDGTIICYRASAESARYSKIVASAMYGRPPTYGYIFGGSGGSIRTQNCIENVEGVWDGAVPFVSPFESTGVFFTAQANALRVMTPDALDRINDAVAVGGSGNPFEGLSAEQAQALRTLYQCGFPRRIGLENPWEQVLVWTTNWAKSLGDYDPTYFDDFWNKPGYVGHDDPESLATSRVHVNARVKRLLTARELVSYKPPFTVIDEVGQGEIGRHQRFVAPDKVVALVLDGGRAQLPRMGCANITFKSGAAKGRDRFITAVIGDAVVGGGFGDELFESVKIGDQVLIDNSKYLAYCFYYRHQAKPKFKEWSHSVVDGKPIYPQRPILKVLSSINEVKYDFGGRKVIMVANLMDRGTLPSHSAAYRRELIRLRGTDYEKANYRLWFNDNAWHSSVTQNLPNDKPPVLTTRLIDYQGSVHRALLALIDWVERGKTPLPSTNYEYTDDCDIIVPPFAGTRGGLQPVIALSGNGATDRVSIKAGDTVDFTGIVECPPKTGTVVQAAWDYDGAGNYPFKHADIDGRSQRLVLHTRHRYDTPGTYFATLRAASHPTGDLENPLYRLPNLGRIRIVVT